MNAGRITGAMERRIGRFEQANGGTLFLDEIGEIDANTQVEDTAGAGGGTLVRAGGGEPIHPRGRARDRRDEQEAREAGGGGEVPRTICFTRLNVVQITMPPLRARREDIPMLVSAFLRHFASENNKPARELTMDAMTAILNYDWPGNVRELRTAIEHGVVMAGGPKITLRDLPATVRQGVKMPVVIAGAEPGPGGDQLNLHETEHRLIIRALDETSGNRTEAAQKLGISRRTLHRKLKELKEHKEVNGD